jgi:3-oxoacyl-[acyl-carrier-protein] synthase III
MYALFKSIGAYIPKEIRSNQWFVDRMDTSDEWITKRTGISERRIAEKRYSRENYLNLRRYTKFLLGKNLTETSCFFV